MLRKLRRYRIQFRHAPAHLIPAGRELPEEDKLTGRIVELNSGPHDFGQIRVPAQTRRVLHVQGLRRAEERARPYVRPYRVSQEISSSSFISERFAARLPIHLLHHHQPARVHLRLSPHRLHLQPNRYTPEASPSTSSITARRKPAVTGWHQCPKLAPQYTVAFQGTSSCNYDRSHDGSGYTRPTTSRSGNAPSSCAFSCPSSKSGRYRSVYVSATPSCTSSRW